MNLTSSNKCFKITFEFKTGIYGPDWSAHTRLCIWHPTLTRTMSASDDINPLVQSWEPEHDFPLDIVSLPSRIATSFLWSTFNTTTRAEQSQNGLSYSDICSLLAGIVGGSVCLCRRLTGFWIWYHFKWRCSKILQLLFKDKGHIYSSSPWMSRCSELFHNFGGIFVQ